MPDEAKGFYFSMKHYALLLGILTFFITSCGVDSKHFKIEGRILNMNQGEFYVYNDEGMIDGIDTIKVEGGRFAYEMPCDRATTVMLVFPNFSEQPIYATSGKSVDIKGDASHLKMLEVKGTKDNELMTKFRLQIANASPPETKKYAGQFAEDHPESPVSVFLVKKYFVIAPSPDFKEAARLIQILHEKQPTNGALNRMAMLIKGSDKVVIGAKLPTFTAYDTKGRLVSSADLSSGLAIISTWATWDYESMNQQRTIKEAVNNSRGRLKAVSICIEASRADCLRQLKNDSITWSNVCDGMMFENKTVRQLGLLRMPDNMLIKGGRIVDRCIPLQDLKMKIEENLK